MTLHWTPTTLALVDDDYDRDNASDRYSRYGAYVAQHAGDFDAWSPQPLTAAEFATAAWRIATSPIMSPGYVRIRPDLYGIGLNISEDDPSLLVARISVPLPHSQLRTRLPYEFRDWEHSSYREHPYPEFVYPPDSNVSVLTAASVSVPMSDRNLLAPKHLRGRGLVDEARQAVRLLATQINAVGGPVVERLRTRNALPAGV